MSPASDATLAIDAPTDLSILSEVREGWNGHWPGQERICCDRKCFCTKSRDSVGDNIVRKCNNIGLVFVIRYGALSCHSVYHSMYSTSLSCLHFFLCNPSIPLYNFIISNLLVVSFDFNSCLHCENIQCSCMRNYQKETRIRE